MALSTLEKFCFIREVIIGSISIFNISVVFFRTFNGFLRSCFNRALPDSWMDAVAPKEAAGEIRQLVQMWSTETQRQHDAREEFSARHGAHVVTVPWSATTPNDMGELESLISSATNMPWAELGIEAG